MIECHTFRWMHDTHSVGIFTGLGFKVGPRFGECCRQVEAEVICNSRNKIHRTWPNFLAEPCRYSLNSRGRGRNSKGRIRFRFEQRNLTYPRFSFRIGKKVLGLSKPFDSTFLEQNIMEQILQSGAQPFSSRLLQNKLFKAECKHQAKGRVVNYSSHSPSLHFRRPALFA